MCEKNIGANTCRSAPSKNLVWSAEGATICVYSTAQNIGTYLFSDKRFLTKNTEMYNETSSEKNEKRVFGRNTKASCFMKANYRKKSPHHCLGNEMKNTFEVNLRCSHRTFVLLTQLLTPYSVSVLTCQFNSNNSLLNIKV